MIGTALKGMAIGMTACLALASANAAAETEIIVDAAKSPGPVQRHVFGHNMESADSRGIFDVPFSAPPHAVSGQGFWDSAARKPYPAVVAQTKALGIGMMRYPGGCLAHNYDWRKAVGPLEKRGKWTFGVDEYIELCRALGAEPLFTVSDYVLPLEEMPAHAAELVEYLNSPATPEHPWAMKRKEWGHPEPYGVKWFELGNESDHGNHKCVPRRCYSPSEYADYAVKCAAAMRKVDPSIKIGVVTRPGTGEDFDCDWNRVVCEKAVPIADFLIVHFYGPRIGGNDPESNFKSAMAYPEQLERYMAAYRELCVKLGGKELPLAITEYNIGHSTNKPIPYRFSLTAGLLCADMMRVYLQPEAKVANAEYWQVANGWWGMFNTKGDEIALRRAVLPFYELWGGHFGDKLVASEVKGSPCFDAPPTGGQPPAEGSVVVKPAKIEDAGLGSMNFAGLKAEGVEASGSPETLFLKFDGLSKSIYVPFASFKREGSALYRIKFESCFVAGPKGAPNATLGLSLIDARGWDKTQSGMAVDAIEKDKDWTAHSGDFITRRDCPGVSVFFRAPGVGAPVYGTLEVRNLRVECWSSGCVPAYQGLTAIASTSKDGEKLHLLVFNKSFDKEIESSIVIKGFTALSAKSWTASNEKTDSLDYKAPLENPEIKLSGSAPFKFKFPAHSMTAFDFVRK